MKSSYKNFDQLVFEYALEAIQNNHTNEEFRIDDILNYIDNEKKSELILAYARDAESNHALDCISNNLFIDSSIIRYAISTEEYSASEYKEALDDLLFKSFIYYVNEALISQGRIIGIPDYPSLDEEDEY